MSPACSTKPSSAPGSESANGPGARPGGGGRAELRAGLEHDGGLALVLPAPGAHRDRHAGLGHPRGLAQRPGRVARELERVEAGDEREGVVVEGQLLHVAGAEVAVGHALAGHLEQRLGGVEPGHPRAALARQLGGQAGAAAHVEQTGVLPTPVASSTASKSGRTWTSCTSAQSRGRWPQRSLCLAAVPDCIGAILAGSDVRWNQQKARRGGATWSQDAQSWRSYRLLDGESLPDGMARVARGRIGHALGQLNNGDDPDKAVHEARKDMKKLRAVLRLTRPELGGKIYRRENTRFRDVALSLSGSVTPGRCSRRSTGSSSTACTAPPPGACGGSSRSTEGARRRATSRR